MTSLLFSAAGGLLTAIMASIWAIAVSGGMVEPPQPGRIVPSHDIRTW